MGFVISGDIIHCAIGIIIIRGIHCFGVGLILIWYFFRTFRFGRPFVGPLVMHYGVIVRGASVSSVGSILGSCSALGSSCSFSSISHSFSSFRMLL